MTTHSVLLLFKDPGLLITNHEVLVIMMRVAGFEPTTI